MRRLILCFCLILFQTAFCSAKDKSPENALLWRISGNGTVKPSYVFGTIHLICADDFIWTDPMKNALSSSEKVCFELDLDDPSLFTEMASGLADTSGLSLQSQLSAEEYKRLRRFFKDSLHVDLATLENLNPTTLSSLLLMRILSCGMPVSFEEKIMEQASKSNKEILGLEKVSEQLAVLDSVSSDSAGKELLSLIDSLPSIRAQYREMVSLYKKQDLDALCKWITTSDLPWEPMNALLDDRNKKWITRMQTSMKSTSVFFAVGAAHLCGQQGIISLLRQAGYTLTPVL